MRAAYVLGLGILLATAAPAVAGDAPRPIRPMPVDADADARPLPPKPAGALPVPAPVGAAAMAAPAGARTATAARAASAGAQRGTAKPATAAADGTKPTAGTKPAAGAKPDAPAPTSSAVDHDTVILDNQQSFQGTVLSNQDDPTQVSINTGSGVMIIRRERIQRVEYGLTARMGRVKADDLNGLVDLAHWCRNNSRNPEALTLLTKAVALPGCDLPTRGLYAQLIDEIHGAEPALPLYIAYRNAGGTDREILARLSELEKARQAWVEQMNAIGLNPDATSETGAPVAAATASQVEEGYEKYTWVGDNPKFANPVEISQTTLATPEGPRKVLQVDYKGKDDANQYSKAAVVLRRPLNLDQTRKLSFLAANRSSKDVRLAVAVKTGNEWTYFESTEQKLPATTSGQEFQSVTFDLGASTFKSAVSGWSHTAKIAGLDNLRELQILILNGTLEGSLWLAGIAFSDRE